MTRILFLCSETSSRTQMAEGLARNVLGVRAKVSSAASQPTPIHTQAAAAMAEIGIDISQQQAKSLDSIDFTDLDFVITLDSSIDLPTLPSHVKHLKWNVPAPEHGQTELTPEMLQKRFSAARDQLKMRIEVLSSLLELPPGPDSAEFHGSIRVKDLPQSVRFYAWLLNTWPKSWTHRSVTFIRADLKLNFVLLVSDDKTLHQDTLYHLGIDVSNRQAVIDAYHNAVAFGCVIAKPPRTTWMGTPLHELWLKDPDGTLIEIYSRLSEEELRQKPADERTVFLVPGTETPNV